MKVDLTKTQIKNLAEFIEFNLLQVIRNDDDIDNILWVGDMCEAYNKLREAEKALAEMEK